MYMHDMLRYVEISSDHQISDAIRICGRPPRHIPGAKRRQGPAMRSGPELIQPSNGQFLVGGLEHFLFFHILGC